MLMEDPIQKGNIVLRRKSVLHGFLPAQTSNC